MKMTTGLVLALICLFSSGAGSQEKKEIDKLAGTWSVTKVLFNDTAHKLKMNFVFKGDEVVVEADDSIKAEYAHFKFKIDPTTTPKLFDITISAGAQKDAAMEGIYEHKGDELTICLKVFGKDRPVEFASPDGGSIALLVLKRAN